MPCYKPLLGFHAPGKTITFDKSKSYGIPIELPCGRCIGCRLENAKQWALRCMHESQMHQDNEFLTLTYDQEHLPQDATLHYPHFQQFMKNLRQKFKKKTIRFYMCGEYGEATEKNNFVARPHYHAILFGISFPDRRFVTERNGLRVYRSEICQSLWKKGNEELGSVTFQSAGYVARYILKKQGSKNEYPICDADTGEVVGQRTAPFTRMSLRPGIGESWYRKNKMDLFPHDYAVLPDGRKTPVPKYYRRLLERDDPALASQLRKSRVEKAVSQPDNTPERLSVREFCKEKQTQRLKRTL